MLEAHHIDNGNKTNYCSRRIYDTETANKSLFAENVIFFNRNLKLFQCSLHPPQAMLLMNLMKST